MKFVNQSFPIEISKEHEVVEHECVLECVRHNFLLGQVSKCYVLGNLIRNSGSKELSIIRCDFSGSCQSAEIIYLGQLWYPSFQRVIVCRLPTPALRLLCLASCSILRVQIGDNERRRCKCSINGRSRCAWLPPISSIVIYRSSSL